LESLDWKFLPEQGGILDQPEWLLEDLTTIAWYKGVVEEMLKEAPSGTPTKNIL
jgi:hypothetical protein